MERTTIALLTLLLAIGAGTAAEAQATRWQTLDAEAASLQKQGRYDRAWRRRKRRCRPPSKPSAGIIPTSPPA